MSNLKQLARFKMLPAFFLLAVAAIFTPSAAHAQSPVCASAIVDPYGEVENTVCISGDVAELDFYQEVDNNTDGGNGDLLWYPSVSASMSIYNDGTLLVDDIEGGSGLYGNASAEYSLTPNIDTEYELEGDAGGCYDETNGNNHYGCSTVDFGSLDVALYASGYAGYIDPKYIVLGVTYAPPGPQSSVTYSNSQSVATTNSLKNTVSTGTSYSVSVTYSGGILGWKAGGTVGQSTSSTQTTTDGESTTLSWSVENLVETFGTPTAIVNGSYTSPVNHDNDIIYIWLNPVETFTLSQNVLVWNGYGYDANDQNGMDIVPIELGYLNGDFGAIPSQYQTSLARAWAASQTDADGNPVNPALTTADFQYIATFDPFSSSSYGPNEIGSNPPVPDTPDDRFTISRCNSENSEPFYQADPSQSPENVTCTLSYSNMTTIEHDYSTGSTTTYSVDKSFQGGGFLAGWKIDVNSSNTLTTSTEVDSSISSTQGTSATLNIVGLPCNNVTPYEGPCVPVYPGPPTFPTQFVIYQDDLYGTFMFAPEDYY